jgi:hypothetical protein
MVKIARPCIFLFLATATLLGQNTAAQTAKKPAARKPSVTRIVKHRLGETFADWLAIEDIDVAQSMDQTLANVRQTGSGEVSSRPGYGNFSWTFHDGKLESAMIVFEIEEAAHQVAFLRQTYGPPSNISEVPVQNGFGARWNDTVAIWDMPDGTIIRLHADRGPDPCVFVNFEPKQLKTPPSNPYK